MLKPTKPIKSSRPNCTAIGRKTDHNRYASVLIMRKPIPIGSVRNSRKNRADRIAHTPRCDVLSILERTCWTSLMLL